MSNEILNFWNSRAGMKEKAGTNDLIAKQLEMEAIKSYIQDGMNVLDFGCGNGMTALHIAKDLDVSITGMDFSQNMIDEAKESLVGFPPTELKGRAKFIQGSLDTLKEMNEKGMKFDIVYTERVLINLKTWEEQKNAILLLCGLLKKSTAQKHKGYFLMCENFMDGVDYLNEKRKALGLGEIKPPWHNRYLREDEIMGIVGRVGGIYTLLTNYYSATYYFLSRIVNAYHYAQFGEDPEYNSHINQLALMLPGMNCWHEYAQGRIVVWMKM